MSSPPSIGWRAVAIYAAISILCAWTWWRGVLPFLFLSSDSANIASFAAGWMTPDAFGGDAILEDKDQYRFYATIHIPLLIALSHVFGDLGTASLSLVVPTMLLQAVGSHRLGAVLTGETIGAWLFGLASFGMVSLTIDYYGTHPDAQPRSLYSAIFPFLLAELVVRAQQPRKWTGLFAAHGLGAYIHPVSAPSVALASWLALACHRRRWRDLPRLLLAGGVFLAIFLPFAINYLTSHEHGVTADYERISALFPVLFGSEYSDGLAYAETMLTAWQARVLMPLFGVAGAIAVWLLEPQRRDTLALTLWWLVAIVAASLGVTLLEQAATRALRVIPPEIDTIRNLRYVVPLLTAWGLWGTVVAARHAFSPRAAIVAVGAIGAAWLLANKPGIVPVRATVACLMNGKLVCQPATWLERLPAYEWLRVSAPRRTKVLPAVDRDFGIDVGPTIRYYAGLPVVFAYKDGGPIFGYANHAKVDAWLETARRLQALHSGRDVSGILSLADDLGAGIVLFDFPAKPPIEKSWSVLFGHGSYTVMGRSAR